MEFTRKEVFLLHQIYKEGISKNCLINSIRICGNLDLNPVELKLMVNKIKKIDEESLEDLILKSLEELYRDFSSIEV